MESEIRIYFTALGCRLNQAEMTALGRSLAAQGHRPVGAAGNADLIEQVLIAKSEGKKVIGLLLSGRPLIITPYLSYFDAFVACWLPGSEAGSGIADVLYGDYDFTGKLPVTWPKYASGLGMNSNSDVYDPSLVLYPFGYGLNYREE